MTVTNVAPVIIYTLTGITDYDFTFRVFEETDLVVIHIDTDDTITTLVLDTDYSVTLNEDGTGTVVIVDTDLEGQLTIARDLPLTQEVSWVNNDPLDMVVQENSFDKLTMLIQEIESASISYPPGFPTTVDFPLPQSEAVIGWSTDATTLVNYPSYGSFQTLYDGAIAAAANAATSETNASNSATAAATSESNAAISESNASDSATAAATSESNAAISESNASDSATAAATSESNASDSATAAATSESNASNSATAAASSASDAAAAAAAAALSAAQTLKHVTFYYEGVLQVDDWVAEVYEYLTGYFTGFYFTGDVTITKLRYMLRVPCSGSNGEVTMYQEDVAGDTLTLTADYPISDTTVSIDVTAGTAFGFKITGVGSTEPGQGLSIIMDYIPTS